MVHLEELGPAAEKLRRARRVTLLACGTSWHAALVGKFILEQVSKVPAEVDYASEFRYRTPIVDPETLAVGISQSGETADTLAAFREVKRLGALPIAICNVQGSMITREAEGTLLTHAGPEIGVASTKAFTSQIVALALLALHLGRLRETLSADECRTLLESLARVPQLMERALMASGRLDAALAVGGVGQGLPLPGPWHQLPDRPRGRPEDEGDLLHPRRGLSGGGDEARPHRPHRRDDAGGGPVPAGPHLREDALQHPGGEGPRGPRDRGGGGGRQAGPRDPRSRKRPRLRRAPRGRGLVAAA